MRSPGDSGPKNRGCSTGCSTDAQRGSVLADEAPLTCGSTVGLTGFEPATP
jgi:hypothetical protein